MDRKEFNREKAKKSLKLAALCFLLMFIIPLILQKWTTLAVLAMSIVNLGFFIFLIRAIILFIGQKFIPTTDEARQKREERNKGDFMTNLFVCTMCGYVGLPKRTAKGSLGIEIVLWLCFLIPGIIYSLWRFASYHNACPKCKNASMIPADSPMGRKLVEANKS